MKRIYTNWYFIIIITGLAVAAFIFFHMGGIRTWQSYSMADYAIIGLGLIAIKGIVRMYIRGRRIVHDVREELRYYNNQKAK